MVTAIAERDATLVTNSEIDSGNISLALAEMMLLCLSSSSRSTADAALDYFTAINTVPVSSRHPQLCFPLFSSALPHLLRHAQYSQGFTSWEEENDDEDEFYR